MKQKDKRSLQIHKGCHVEEQLDFFPLKIPEIRIKTVDGSYRKTNFGSMSGEKKSNREERGCLNME